MSDRKNWLVGSSSLYGRFDDEVLKEHRDNNITLMELSYSDAYYKETLDFFNKSEEIVERALSHGVKINSIHLPFNNTTIDPSSMDESVRVNTVELFTNYIKASAKAGIPIAVIHPSTEPIADCDREAHLKNSIKSLTVLSELCDSLGMKLAVENLPRTCLCTHHDEMVKLLEACPKLNVVFDTNHNLYETDEEYIEAIGDRIITLHVSDYDFIDERHWLPTKGKINWESVIQTLEKVNYTGPWMYEVGQRGGPVTFADLRANVDMLLGV